MKKLILLLFICTSINGIAQNNNDKIVTEPLMTVEQKVNVQLVFIERIKELKLPKEKLNKYETIIDDNIFYMIQLNKKRNLTKSQIKSGLDKIIVKQNAALKNILTPEQYKKHLKIYDETIGNAIKNRLKEY